MPRYAYQSPEAGEEFVFFHDTADPVMISHPETGESIEPIITEHVLRI